MSEEKKSFLERLGARKTPVEEFKSKTRDVLEDNIANKNDYNEDESVNMLNRDKNSFMDHLIRSRNDLCFQVMGKDSTGRVAWYFVLIDKEKKEKFLSHKPGDSYDLADYGKIIVSGYGEFVPQDVKDMLKEKYGFDSF
jgi:hypothetical protein